MRERPLWEGMLRQKWCCYTGSKVHKPRIFHNTRILHVQETVQSHPRWNAQIICISPGSWIKAQPHPHLLCIIKETCFCAVHWSSVRVEKNSSVEEGAIDWCIDYRQGLRERNRYLLSSALFRWEDNGFSLRWPDYQANDLDVWYSPQWHTEKQEVEIYN